MALEGKFRMTVLEVQVMDILSQANWHFHFSRSSFLLSGMPKSDTCE